MSNKHYSFQSTWTIDAPPKEVWRVLTATPFSWPDWWPELNDVHDMKLAPNLAGSSFSCTWKAPIGYRLKSDIIIGDIVYLESVTIHAHGDLLGTVICRIHDEDGKTRLEIDWQVVTTKPWMNRLTFLLRPLFVWSHHAVMRSGEHGLRNYIKSRS